MNKEKMFTASEKRVLRSLYRLGRWATANEIAEWADDMSWNTAKSVLIKLRRERIVEMKMEDNKMQWKIKEFE